MSDSRQKTEPHETDSEKAAPKKEEGASSSLSSALEGLTLKEGCSSSEYMPSEYGYSCLGSSVINTFSDAHFCTRCEVTDSPKIKPSSEEDGDKKQE